MSVEIKSESITMVNIDKLVPYADNPNDHSEAQIDRLCDLIQETGFRTPVIAQKGTSIIASGHGRVMAAKKLGMEKVPVVYQEFKNEAEFYAYVVADNAIGEWSSLDFGKINEKFVDFGPDFNVSMMGFKNFEIDPMEVEPPTIASGDKECESMNLSFSMDKIEVVYGLFDRVKSKYDNCKSREDCILKLAELF